MIGTRTWLLATLAAAVCVGMFGAPAGATPYTLTSNNSTVRVDPASSTGVYDWFVDGVGYNLYQEWFWMRIGDAAGTGQQALVLTPYFVGAREIEMCASGTGWSVDIDMLLKGGPAGSMVSDIAQTIVVTNTTGQTLHFFQYADFDLLGDPSNDLVTVDNADAVRQTKANNAMALSESVVGPAPAIWETDFYRNILNKLDSTTNYDLNPTPIGVTKGPGDMTWAAEWNLGRGTTIISKDLRLVVPEPVTMFSAFMAISGLGLYIRKRTRVA